MPPRLLFDENLSDRLPRLVEGLYPGARHLYDLGLQGATDEAVWATGIVTRSPGP